MNEILFENLPISEEVKRGLAEMGFERPTAIQAQSIPHILEGRDVIGRSQTGTGKTAAFGIPAIESIDLTKARKVQVLVLCPTRELAMQASGEIEKFAKYVKGVKPVAVYGGASIERQISQLRGGANMVIGTPGRVMDHMRRGTLKLNDLHMIILDEADEMLNMGFREDIETILKEVPEERQTVLFSATMPPAILAITKMYQQDPVLIQVGADNSPIAAIEQTYYEAPMGRKMDVLALLLHSYDPGLAIIFSNTKSMVDELADYLGKHGFRAAGIHGDMKQSARTQVMNNFKSHRTPILIATDVAARGIDVENVDMVINYDIPQDLEYYIHRIGRTARAGKEGKALTIISGRKQFYQIKDIQTLTGSKIQQKAVPTRQQVLEIKRDVFLDQVRKAQPESEMAKSMIDTLLAEGMEMETIAHALLEMLYREETLDIPEVSIVQSQGQRPGRGGTSSGIVLNLGRRHRMAPNFIVGAIADATGLSGKQVGKIEIFDDHTIVQMSPDSANLAVDTMKSLKINGYNASVRLITAKDQTGSKRIESPAPRSQNRRGGQGSKGSYGNNRPRRQSKPR